MIKMLGRAYSILLIYIILVILYHLFGYSGHYGYDDIHYAELATNLLKGTVNFEDHYAYRFPVILFTAMFYALFGINDLASSLPALAITIATGGHIYVFLDDFAAQGLSIIPERS